MTKSKRLRWVISALAFAGLVAFAASSAGGASNAPGGANGDAGRAIASVRAALASDRIVDATLNNGDLHVVLKKGAAADSPLSIWYGKVFAQAVADKVATDGSPGEVATASYGDGSGIDINGGADRIGKPAASIDLGKGTCERVAHTHAAAAGVKVIDARTLDVLGGACVLILQPQGSLAAFVADASGQLGSLLAGIPSVQTRPYLVEIVDGAGTTQLALGWVPRLGGGIGEGTAWLTPGTTSSAVLGSTPAIAGG